MILVKRKTVLVVLFVMLIVAVPVFAQRTADLFIQNQIVSGGYLYFEIHITPTNDWGTLNRKALGDCSWFFTYNTAALSNPVLTYENPTYVPSGSGYSNSTGLTGGRVQVTTDLDTDNYDGVNIPQGQKTHVYTVQMDIDDSGASSNLNWDQINTGIFNAQDNIITETYYGGSDISLPIEVTSFSLSGTSELVLINWITESEVDNLGFVLEQAQGNAPLQWVEIASYITHPELKGQSNTSAKTEYIFMDVTAQPGKTYSYRLSDVNIKGYVTVNAKLSITLDALPECTELLPACPNPFNPVTKISYQLATTGPVEISVYDLMGRKVSTLLNQEQNAGNYILYWNGKDDSGRQAASGTYILRMIAEDVTKIQKVLLMR